MCWRSAAAEAQNLILIEVDGKYQFVGDNARNVGLSYPSSLIISVSVSLSLCLSFFLCVFLSSFCVSLYLYLFLSLLFSLSIFLSAFSLSPLPIISRTVSLLLQTQVIIWAHLNNLGHLLHLKVLTLIRQIWGFRRSLSSSKIVKTHQYVRTHDGTALVDMVSA